MKASNGANHASSQKPKYTYLLSFYATLALIILIIQSYTGLWPVRDFLFYLINPSLQGADILWKTTSRAADRLFSITTVSQENTLLREQIHKLEALTNYQKEILKENERLRLALDWQTSSPYKLVPREIVGRPAIFGMSKLIIAWDTTQELSVGTPVVTFRGDKLAALGVVSEVSAGLGYVMLITDPACEVWGLVVRTRQQGIVQGTGGAKLLLKFLLPDADVIAGDEIVTAGLGGVFPRSLKLGIVESVSTTKDGLGRVATVVPDARTDAVNEVFLVVK
jgi:rod shape-determining protein MreC